MINPFSVLFAACFCSSQPTSLYLTSLHSSFVVFRITTLLCVFFEFSRFYYTLFSLPAATLVCPDQWTGSNAPSVSSYPLLASYVFPRAHILIFSPCVILTPFLFYQGLSESTGLPRMQGFWWLSPSARVSCGGMITPLFGPNFWEERDTEGRHIKELFLTSARVVT